MPKDNFPTILIILLVRKVKFPHPPARSHGRISKDLKQESRKENESNTSGCLKNKIRFLCSVEVCVFKNYHPYPLNGEFEGSSSKYALVVDVEEVRVQDGLQDPS